MHLHRLSVFLHSLQSPANIVTQSLMKECAIPQRSSSKGCCYCSSRSTILVKIHLPSTPIQTAWKVCRSSPGAAFYSIPIKAMLQFQSCGIGLLLNDTPHHHCSLLMSLLGTPRLSACLAKEPIIPGGPHMKMTGPWLPSWVGDASF